MNAYLITSFAFLTIIAVTALYFSVQFWKDKRYYQVRFSDVIDTDAEIAELNKQKSDLEAAIVATRNDYVSKHEIYERLKREVAVYDEKIELAELGIYKPHFHFDTPEKYKQELTRTRDLQKQMVKDGRAVFAETEWKVDGSEAKGRQMSQRAVKLTARAFNNECDAAISNVTWRNAGRMIARVEKACEKINALNQTNRVVISIAYLDLKIREIRLTHEFRQKQREEREEQAEIRRRMREEEKLQQEAQKAAQEEEKFQQMLNRAKKEAEAASGAEQAILQSTLVELEAQLAEAHAKNERAISMAQQTKFGHIYVLSNIGSFGEDVYKIGMTRRLDPMDRVRELGDASVPFIFDVHALIYVEDAPGVERSLHKVFESRRVNLVNHRKEFFRASLAEIKTEVIGRYPDAEFVETVEAREFIESLMIARKPEESNDEFPDAL